MSAATIVTIIVVAFIVLAAVYGFTRGFVRILITTLALVLTLVLAGIFAPMLAKSLSGSKIGKDITNSISKVVNDKIGGQISTDAKETQDTIIDKLPLPDIIKKNIAKDNTSDTYQALGVKTFNEYISTRLTGAVLSIISFFILAIIIYIILRIILGVAKVLNKIPIVKGINRLFGAIVGIAEALIILWVICLFFTCIAQTPFGLQVIEIINQSELLKLIYNNNLLVICATKLIASI